MNNPLLFTDPSGYRPEALFEEEERMQRSGGGNGFDYFGWISFGTEYMQEYIASKSWIYNNGYHINTHTGEVAYSNHEFFGSYTREHGGSYDRYTIFETGTSLDGGLTFVGNGKFGIIHEGVMKSTGMFPSYISKKQCNTFLNLFLRVGREVLNNGDLRDYLSNKEIWNYGNNMAYYGAYKLAYEEGKNDATNKTPFEYPGLGSPYPKEIRRAFWKFAASDPLIAGSISGKKDGEYFGYVHGFRDQWKNLNSGERGEYDPVSPILPKWYELITPLPID